uniref:Nucleotide-diphospho-sugar transferase domain-containing protein n=1 Tax=Aplanochytrium stocchinoi TaxID=215587 RepID=A0A7S3LTD8_9STRA|mmetsp:Transcript_11309/g.14110  ORF Transcript_11309/g.14110 Transcript_11309/m.14110 type:complete len:344 (-) Transcript_11309:1097-2128(-)
MKGRKILFFTFAALCLLTMVLLQGFVGPDNVMVTPRMPSKTSTLPLTRQGTLGEMTPTRLESDSQHFTFDFFANDNKNRFLTFKTTRNPLTVGSRSNYAHGTNTYFVSYGDARFRKSRLRIFSEAKSSGYFDYGVVFTPEGLPDELVQNENPLIREILRQHRGGGYWVWKMFIIKWILEVADEGDFVFYADSGCTIRTNDAAVRRFDDYKKILTESKYGVLSFQLKFPEQLYTTSKIFEHFDVPIDSPIRKSGQFMATVVGLRKGPHQRKIFDMYFEALYTDPHLITDAYNADAKRKFKDFRDNRHDQSVLSVIRKLLGADIIPTDETFRNSSVPFEAIRRKG